MNTSRIIEILEAFSAEQDGVTAIEYALLAALIFAVIITSVGLVGTKLDTFFAYVATIFPLPA